MKRVLIIAVVLVALLVSVGLVLPDAWSVERSVVIAADRQQIYALVASPKRWNEWTAWTTKSDPSLVFTYSGPDIGAGAEQAWTSEASGNGRLKITSANPRTGVDYDLLMEGGKMKARGNILMQQHAQGTLVSWSLLGEVGSDIVARYFGLLMDSFVGKDLEVGLATLEAQAEAMPATPTTTRTTTTATISR